MKLASLLPAAVVAAACAALPAPAFAATASIVTASVNLRAGPGMNFPVVTVMPQGAAVATYGCLPDYSWCDVSFVGARGWVAARFLTVPVGGTRVVVTPAVGLPVVTFGPTYWNRYYVGYPWYARGPAYYGRPPVYQGRCIDGCSGSTTVTGPAGGTRTRIWSVNP